MTDDDAQRLKAAAFHDVTPETPAIEIDIFPHKDENFTAAIKDTNWSLNRTADMVCLSDEWGEILIFDHEIDTVIALLIRARQIMAKGGD